MNTRANKLPDPILLLFLLMGGYLKQTAMRKDDVLEKAFYNLSIPNKEVRSTYTGIIQRFFTGKIENKKVQIMLNALMAGDIKLVINILQKKAKKTNFFEMLSRKNDIWLTVNRFGVPPHFEKMLRKIVTAVFSYHDFSGEPEKVYHALVTGLLVWITNTHEIKSNRESGCGRYDIMIIPHDTRQTGYVIEFKAVDPEDNETVETAAASALAQIEEKKYETELIDRGIKNIKKLAVVFKGKEVTIKEEPGLSGL